tara:strand:+ start:137117 stop:138586 length:1470 start_codon:yes stop_codon:yes gene_type:complete
MILMQLLAVGWANEQPPNVVVIFIDDMGYADIGPFGAQQYKTPNLNRMAREGRKFTDFVVSSAVCSASRSALMTGCYHRRVGISGALGPKSNIGLNPSETTLAEVCKSKGYATAAFGKWHLGHHPKFLPTNQGFDVYQGIPYSNDMWPLHPKARAIREKDPNAPIPWAALPMLKSSEPNSVKVLNEDMQPEDQAEMTRQFTELAVDFIKSSVDQPFFVYLPHPMVHVPLFPGKDFYGKSGVGLFADVVMELDWSVGEIMKAVEDIGAENNTLVIFTSDNGPWLSYGSHSGRATPLREGKGTMFEGGYREPTLMWWKGKIPANTTCDELCSTIDILPTVAKLIDAELPDHKIDGKDIRPLMFDEPSAKSPHEAFYCYYKGGELQAVRNESFKLMFKHKYRSLDGHPGGSGGLPISYKMLEIDQTLFNLDDDVSETKDVSALYPDEVKKLQAAAETARKELGDKLTKRDGDGIRPAGTMDKDDEKLPLIWR